MIIRIAGITLIIGLFIGLIGLFAFIFLFLATGLSLFVLMIAFLSDRDTKKKTKKYPLLIFFILFLSLLESYGVMKLKHWYQLREAKEVIVAIEKHKQMRGFYPAYFNSATLFPLHYTPDTMQQQYIIHFVSDGWHSNHYDSQTRKWVTND